MRQIELRASIDFRTHLRQSKVSYSREPACIMELGNPDMIDLSSWLLLPLLRDRRHNTSYQYLTKTKETSKMLTCGRSLWVIPFSGCDSCIKRSPSPPPSTVAERPSGKGYDGMQSTVFQEGFFPGMIECYLLERFVQGSESAMSTSQRQCHYQTHSTPSTFDHRPSRATSQFDLLCSSIGGGQQPMAHGGYSTS